MNALVHASHRNSLYDKLQHLNKSIRRNNYKIKGIQRIIQQHMLAGTQEIVSKSVLPYVANTPTGLTNYLSQ